MAPREHSYMTSCKGGKGMLFFCDVITQGFGYLSLTNGVGVRESPNLHDVIYELSLTC